MNSWIGSSRSSTGRPERTLALTILLFLLVAAPAPFLGQTVPILPASVEQIAGGFKFVEGPLWRQDIGLLFSDIHANRIYQWQPDSGVRVFLEPSDSSNGLTFDLAGSLVLTQMALRRIARMEVDGRLTSLVSNFQGKRFNCPNDLAYSNAGSLFFTDPDFNIPNGQSSEIRAQGIYRLMSSGSVTLLDRSFEKPNGICFSPDGKTLYVNESPRCVIYAWDVLNDSTITNKRVHYSIPRKGYADGMKTDASGTLYCTGPGGVWVIEPSGSLRGLVPLPESPTNCTWGDADGKSLYVTATTGVYRIRWE